jgi:hypothetical protein
MTWDCDGFSGELVGNEAMERIETLRSLPHDPREQGPKGEYLCGMWDVVDRAREAGTVEVSSHMFPRCRRARRLVECTRSSLPQGSDVMHNTVGAGK